MTVDNRRHPRVVTSTPAQVRWTGANRLPTECNGTIRDYSRSGLRIEIAQAVPPQSRLTVAANGRMFRGVVRYCNPHESSFMVGIEF